MPNTMEKDLKWDWKIQGYSCCVLKAGLVLCYLIIKICWILSKAERIYIPSFTNIVDYTYKFQYTTDFATESYTVYIIFPIQVFMDGKTEVNLCLVQCKNTQNDTEYLGVLSW